jgi:hypothetical protein
MGEVAKISILKALSLVANPHEDLLQLDGVAALFWGGTLSLSLYLLN